MSNNEAPERIIAMATRDGAVWKVEPPSRWFGQPFGPTPFVLERISTDLIAGLEGEIEFLRTRIAELEAERDALKRDRNNLHEKCKAAARYLREENHTALFAVLHEMELLDHE